MTYQDIALYPARLLIEFVLMLFGYSALPYLWDVFITGFIALYFWLSVLSAILEWVRRKLGLQGGAQ